jgi:hypothetical protein
VRPYYCNLNLEAVQKNFEKISSQEPSKHFSAPFSANTSAKQGVPTLEQCAHPRTMREANAVGSLQRYCERTVQSLLPHLTLYTSDLDGRTRNFQNTYTWSVGWVPVTSGV